MTKPIVKRGAKELGKFALNTGVNLRSDVLAGKSVKESAKARGLEGAGVAKTRVVQRAQQYAQSGRGRRRYRGGKRTKRLSTRSRSSRRSKSTRQKAKKRKASTSSTRRHQTKKRKASPVDIFG